MRYLFVSAAAVMAITGAAAIGQAQMQDKGPPPGASGPGAGGGPAAGGGDRSPGASGAERSPGKGDRTQQPMRDQKSPGKGAQSQDKGDSKAARQGGDKMDRKSAADQRDNDQKRSADQQRKGDQDQKKAADRDRGEKKAADQRKGDRDEKKAADQRKGDRDQKAADQRKGDRDQKAADQRKGDRDQKAADQRKGDRDGKFAGDQKRDRVQLSDKERTTVRQQLVRGRDVDRINRSRLNVDIRVGVNIPRSVRLHTLPVTLVSTVPAYRGYSYIVLEDETICIVDPDTYVIVDVIPAGSVQAGTRGHLTLSQDDMRFIYRTLPKDRRADVRVRMALGAEVPRQVELYEFPETVIDRIPQVREYRYVVVEDEIVIVDPNDYQVSLVINE